MSTEENLAHLALLSTHSVSKSFSEEIKAVDSVSLKLDAGEILAILGPSGSGKTTLIKMIAGLIQPDQGQVLFHERKLEGPEDKLVPGHEEIRLVHQDFKLHHQMTVGENLKNALLEYVPEYRKERTNELLKLCRIDHIKDQYVHNISGGEKQRVAIAMALSTDPEVLLFDEPFSNLDLVAKSTLLQEIYALAKETHTAVILITHDSRDAMEIADRMIVLHQGKEMRSGTPAELYKNPTYEVVANLIGLFNALSKEQVKKLLPSSNSSKGHSFGLWPEHVKLSDNGDLKGTVQKVIFSGHFHKLLISTRSGISLWAIDWTKQIKEKAHVSLQVSRDHFFNLEDLG